MHVWSNFIHLYYSFFFLKMLCRFLYSRLWVELHFFLILNLSDALESYYWVDGSIFQKEYFDVNVKNAIGYFTIFDWIDSVCVCVCVNNPKNPSLTDHNQFHHGFVKIWLAKIVKLEWAFIALLFSKTYWLLLGAGMVRHKQHIDVRIK